MSNKYIIIFFNESEDLFSGKDMMPIVVDIIKDIAINGSRGASAGPMNICFFSSNLEKEEISKIFLKKKVKFLIINQDDTISSLPKYISKMLEPGFDPDKLNKELEGFGHVERMPGLSSSKQNGRRSAVLDKLSLEDQLDIAVKNEEFTMAAALRDKIKNRNQKKQEVPKEKEKNLGLNSSLFD